MIVYAVGNTKNQTYLTDKIMNEEKKIDNTTANGIKQYVSRSALAEFLEENLQKSKEENWANEMFGAGWIAALMHMKVNFLEQQP